MLSNRKMKNSQFNKLILSGIILCLSATFFYNIKKTCILLPKEYTKNKGGFFALCERTTPAIANPSLLGKLLYKFYGSRSKFIMPLLHNKIDKRILTPNMIRYFFQLIYGPTFNHRYSIELLTYSYPIVPIYKDYDWLLEKDEFELLKSKSTLSKRTEKLRFYLLKAKKLERVGLFIYKDNIVVAPMNWRAEK